MICPTCEKICKNLHYASCKVPEMSKDDFKRFVLQHNFPSLQLQNDKKMKELYIEKQFSLPDFYKIYGIGYKTTLWILSYFKIPKRNLTEANNTTNSISKREQTFLQNYGAINPLSKGTTAYDKRNKTVKEKYGVNNVFQIQEIIDKISTPERKQRELFSKSFYTDEQKTEICRKRMETYSKTFKERGTGLNAFETKISTILTKLGLSFSFSFFISRCQFDFHLSNTNILIECQGDFWHGNPKFFRENDFLSFPGEKKLVQDIWKKDFHKHKLAAKHDYEVLYIWENQIYKKSEEEILTLISNLLQTKLLHLPQITH